jgi:predicted nucleotidyltransferase
MTITTGIVLPETEIATLCRRYHVKELALFGSAARGEMRPDSDVDLLVDFKEDAHVGLVELTALRRELSTIVGRAVDLAVKPGLKPRMRPAILAEARVVYAA